MHHYTVLVSFWWYFKLFCNNFLFLREIVVIVLFWLYDTDRSSFFRSFPVLVGSRTEDILTGMFRIFRKFCRKALMYNSKYNKFRTT